MVSLQVVRDCVRSLRRSNVSVRLKVTTAYKKNSGRIFGGQFQDGVSNAVDAVSMIRY